ncbi:MAG: hypothetical protein ACLFTT_09660 [Candidatus Hydrogenedentota bacterium]
MRNSKRNERGMALLFALIAIIVIFGALSLMMARVTVEKRQSDHAYDDVVLDEAARAGIELAIQQLWNQYVVTNGNTTGNWASYRYYLNNVLQVPNTEDLNGNGVQDEGEGNPNGRNGWEPWPASYETYGYPLLEEPMELRDDTGSRTVAMIDAVHLIRNDSYLSTNLTVRATASVGEKTRSVVQKLSIGGQVFEGAQFAVLANNISCLLCHAEIRSLPLEMNQDPDDYGTFDRVKVASLESLLVRRNAAHSNIAGTLYSRGKVYKQDGSLYAPDELASDSRFNAYQFSDTDGKISQDSSGNMSKTSWVNGEAGDDGELPPFENLYMDYPADIEEQTDGPLPNSFPAPFPDEDNDRMVDDDEFDVVKNAADGSISFALDPEDATGSISAGVAYGVPEGDFYDGESLPEASNSAINQLDSLGAYDGNLVLVGTEDDPINIENRVAVDGDLVIKGSVKGRGQLLVRGNVYVMGDITYADAPGEFGQDETGNDNLFAIVAGGNVMMGDYLTVRGVNHSKDDNAKYPDWRRYSIHTREEHKVDEYDGETLEWGWFDQYSVDANMEVEDRPGQQFSFTMSELQLFNKMEIDKARNDPDYTPRLYGLRESQPDMLYVYDSGDEHAVHYTDSGVKLAVDYLLEEGIPLELLDRAAFQYLNPEGNWISEDTLRNIWFEDEMSRPSSGRPWRLDGLLYSNNAIFTIVRSETRHKSHTYGKMHLRGGVIAADLGVFAPEGFRMDYDPRVERFLNVQDASMVEFQRGPFYYAAATYSEEG